MGLFDIFKKFGGETEKPPPPQKTSLELLEIELQGNMDQFNRFHKEVEIGLGKAEYFKTEVWDHFKEELAEPQKQAFENAYELIQKMNEELSLLEVEKNGYIKGNISRESKDDGKAILKKALNKIH